MKKKEAFFRAIGGVGDDLIARAEQPVSKKNTVWLRWTAMAACCALVACIAAFAHLTSEQSKSTDSVANMNQSAMQAESFSVESSAPERFRLFLFFDSALPPVLRRPSLAAATMFPFILSGALPFCK